MTLGIAGVLKPAPASAVITCYDFQSLAEAQAVYDALPGDPFELDTGWPAHGVVGGGDQEAGNGLACDATKDIPERKAPGNEKYQIDDDDPAKNGLKELLAPDTTVWLEVDEAGFYTATELERHLWIKLDGRYRLVSEVLVTEGHAVVATNRPGTGRGDALKNPPPGSRYRDALRSAQEYVIEARVGLWKQCATET